METKRIIIASDIHLCHADWYGVKAEDRVQKFIDDVKAEYEKQPFEALLLLGDYSLDHWSWQIKGSYIGKGLSNAKRFAEEYLSQLNDLPIEIRIYDDDERDRGRAKNKRYPQPQGRGNTGEPYCRQSDGDSGQE